MSAAARLQELRTELEKRFGSAVLPRTRGGVQEERPGFRTGIDAIDFLLPEGVPRGLLSLWCGDVTSGRTAVTRCLAVAACASGALVALVDATRSLDPSSWCEEGDPSDGLWVVRPPNPDREVEGCWVGEALLRTGAFDLVVIDGPPPSGSEAHRLRTLARETDAALLVSTDRIPSGWRADFRLEFRRNATGGGLQIGGRYRRRTRVRKTKGWGSLGDQEIELVHEPTTHCLHPGPLAPDRRARPGA